MTVVYGPERLAGQGLDPNQEESGNRAIAALLQDEPARSQVDLVITFRDGAYEVWAQRGMVRFRRILKEAALDFEILEVLGDNPIADQRHTLVATCIEEQQASAASGGPSGEPNRFFIEPSELS